MEEVVFTTVCLFSPEISYNESEKTVRKAEGKAPVSDGKRRDGDDERTALGNLHDPPYSRSLDQTARKLLTDFAEGRTEKTTLRQINSWSPTGWGGNSVLRKLYQAIGGEEGQLAQRMLFALLTCRREGPFYGNWKEEIQYCIAAGFSIKQIIGLLSPPVIWKYGWDGMETYLNLLEGILKNGELYYQVQHFAKRKKFIQIFQISGRIKLPHQIRLKILHRRPQLSKNRTAHRTEPQYHQPGDPAQLYPHVRHSNILSPYGPEEVSAAAFLLP